MFLAMQFAECKLVVFTQASHLHECTEGLILDHTRKNMHNGIIQKVVIPVEGYDEAGERGPENKQMQHADHSFKKDERRGRFSGGHSNIHYPYSEDGEPSGDSASKTISDLPLESNSSIFSSWAGDSQHSQGLPLLRSQNQMKSIHLQQKIKGSPLRLGAPSSPSVSSKIALYPCGPEFGPYGHQLRKRHKVNYNPPSLEIYIKSEPDDIDHVESRFKRNKAGVCHGPGDFFDGIEKEVSYQFLDVQSGPECSTDEDIGSEEENDKGTERSLKRSTLVVRRSNRLKKRPWKNLRITARSFASSESANLYRKDDAHHLSGDVQYGENRSYSSSSLSSEDDEGHDNTDGHDKMRNSSTAESTELFDISGLDAHIQILKEMIMWPLRYPEIFKKWNISMPRGVIFHGPPGTGKTMLARALVSACNIHSEGASLFKKPHKVSFYMKSSSEILSKWIGEAEKILQKLFQVARNNAPAVIFFDELDGKIMSKRSLPF